MSLDNNMGALDLAETEDQLRMRHKKEQKEFIATSTAMKKQATKGEKKKRKEINKQIETMEKEMKLRHQDELNDLIKKLAESKIDGNKSESTVENNDNSHDEDDDEFTRILLAQIEAENSKKETEKIETSQAQPIAQPKPKKNRQKERFLAKEAQRKKIIEEAEAEAANQTDYRKIEMDSMNELLKIKGLSIHEVSADGHCLFASIADQLKVRRGIEKTVQELRTEAAEYIRQHPDDFSPFLFDENTMAIRDVGDYTNELENTPLWGGDLEITAFAQIYNSPISVLISGQSPLVINEDGSEPELKLAYYKHSFGLGEHYNSVRG